jgi:hypothetical protein
VYQAMTLIEVVALAAIVLAALYLLALGAAALLMPARSSRFLLGFARSPPIHLLELFLRFVVGAALVCYAPRMLLAGAFNLSGWVLLVTTTCLLLLPWRWHRRFAEYTVPRVTRHITLVGFASLAIGGVLLAAVAYGSAT